MKTEVRTRTAPDQASRWFPVQASPVDRPSHHRAGAAWAVDQVHEARQVECRAAHGCAHGWACAHVLARAHPRARQALRRRLSSPPRPVRGPLNDRTVTSPVTDFWNRRRKNAAIRKKGGRRSRKKKVCLSPGYGAGCYKWTMLSRLKH